MGQARCNLQRLPWTSHPAASGTPLPSSDSGLLCTCARSQSESQPLRAITTKKGPFFFYIQLTFETPTGTDLSEQNMCVGSQRPISSLCAHSDTHHNSLSSDSNFITSNQSEGTAAILDNKNQIQRAGKKCPALGS